MFCLFVELMLTVLLCWSAVRFDSRVIEKRVGRNVLGLFRVLPCCSGLPAYGCEVECMLIVVAVHIDDVEVLVKLNFPKVGQAHLVRVTIAFDT